MEEIITTRHQLPITCLRGGTFTAVRGFRCSAEAQKPVTDEEWEGGWSAEGSRGKTHQVHFLSNSEAAPSSSSRTLILVFILEIVSL